MRRWVVGGAAVYVASASAAYLYFQGAARSKKAIVAPLSEEERRRVFGSNAPKYDDSIHRHEQLAGIVSLRERLVAQAHGRVLEVAVGTGRNLHA